MKFVAFILLFCMLFCIAGCISTEKKDAMTVLVYRYEELQKELADVKARFDAGTLTSAEAKDKVEDIKVLIDDTLAEYNSLKDAGYSTRDIILGLGAVLGQFVLSFLGVNAYRSKFHSLAKEIK